MVYVALAVSVFALAFTVASFWWLHARRGKLTATPPRSYAFADKVRLRFPLAFYNTGAKALIIGDLRLIIETEPSRQPLRWITTRAKLRPGTDDDFAFATPFSIQGRGTKEVVAEFGDDLGWAPIPASGHRMRLQAKVHPSDEWDDVAVFEWWAPPSADVMTKYIAHRNEPPLPPSQEIRFRFADVFPADDDLARWIMSLSIALGDLRVAVTYATRSQQPTHERTYFVRQFASHMRELVKVVQLAPQRSEPLREFVGERLSQEGRAAYNRVSELIGQPMKLRPAVTLLDELKRIRDQMWHYPRNDEFTALLGDAMRRAADDGKGGPDEGVYRLDGGEMRAVYADEVSILLLHPFDGTQDEKREMALELHGRLAELADELGTFLQHAEASYLSERGALNQGD